MKCRICGANLAKENADICVDCYKKYQEEEELKNDTNIIYTIDSRFSMGYEIIKYIEVILIILLAVLGCFALSNIKQAVLCLVGLFLFLLVAIFNDRLKARNNKMTFYESKLVYNTKNILITNEKVLKYSDLADITYFQSIRQKIFKRGDLCIYVKGTLPGGSLIGGAQFKDVNNIKQIYSDLVELLGIDKRK